MASARRNAGLFDQRQMAVLAYAGDADDRSARPSDATYAAVAAFLNEEEIVELTLLIGYYNLVSRALNALEVEPEPAAQRALDEAGWPL